MWSTLKERRAKQFWMGKPVRGWTPRCYFVTVQTVYGPINLPIACRLGEAWTGAAWRVLGERGIRPSEDVLTSRKGYFRWSAERINPAQYLALTVD